MPTIQPSILIRPPVQGQRYDLAKYAVPEGSAHYLRNFVRRDGRVVSRFGHTKFGTTVSEHPNGIINYLLHTGTPTTVMATTAGWFKLDTSTLDWVDITEAGNELTAAETDHQIFRVFYKSGTAWLVGCNGPNDAMVCWDGSASDYQDVGGSPGSPKAMCVLAGRMLLGNFNNAPVKVDVSAVNDFETGWGSTQTVQLYDTPGEIISMNEFGSLIAFIYKTDAIYQATATETLYPFSFYLKVSGVSGPMSPRCVVALPTVHYILARDFNIYKFNGSTYMPLGNHVRSHIKNTISVDRLSRAWGMFDDSRNEVVFYYPTPSSTHPVAGVVIKTLDDTVWPLDVTNLKPTAGVSYFGTNMITIGELLNPLSYYTNPLSDYSTSKRVRLLCGQSGQVYQEQEGVTDDGNTFPLEIQTGMVTPSETLNHVTVTETESRFKKTGGAQDVNLSLMYSDAAASDEAVESSQSFNLGETGPYITGHRRDSVYFGLKITADCQEAVTYEGTKVSGVERGPR